MKVDQFDFDLPSDRIALRPAEPRDAARLLVVPRAGPFEDRRFSELADLLRPGDLLVANDTRVVPAALFATRERPGAEPLPLSLTLLGREGEGTWRAYVKPGRRVRRGDRLVLGRDGSGALPETPPVVAMITGKHEDGTVDLDFEAAGPAAVERLMAETGAIPLPPYIAAKRPADHRDRQDYQTVYARTEGAIAAPTAGLHFTPEGLERLAAAGVDFATVTLHVGRGTFAPVAVEDTDSHRMHAEAGTLPQATADAVKRTRARGGRVIAVGTTSLRLLETAAMEDGLVAPFEGSTNLFITPGFRFRVVDALVTNFHLPRSTLFMLVAAFSGLDRMSSAYAHAIAAGYRFYSYGDASLLWRVDRP